MIGFIQQLSSFNVVFIRNDRVSNRPSSVRNVTNAEEQTLISTSHPVITISSNNLVQQPKPDNEQLNVLTAISDASITPIPQRYHSDNILPTRTNLNKTPSQQSHSTIRSLSVASEPTRNEKRHTFSHSALIVPVTPLVFDRAFEFDLNEPIQAAILKNGNENAIDDHDHIRTRDDNGDAYDDVLGSQSRSKSKSRSKSFVSHFSYISQETADIVHQISVLRANDSKRWPILFCCAFCFVATFHCLLSLSALENSVIKYYGINSSTFASFSTTSFGMAMIASIVIPYWINKYDLYFIVTIAQISTSIGQCLSMLSCYLMIEFGFKYNLYLLYIGRAFIGVGLGIDSVTLQAIVGLWFRQSKDQSVASALTNNSIQIGITTALYTLVPIMQATNKLYWALCLGFLFAMATVPASMYMSRLEKQFNGGCGTNLASDTRRTLMDARSLKLETNYRRAISMINQHANKWLIWGVIIILFCGKGIVDTFANEMQTAYLQIFQLKEQTADWFLSIETFFGLIFSVPIGSLIDKIGNRGCMLMIATVFMTFGIFMLASNDNLNDSYNIPNDSYFKWLNLFGDVNYASSAMPWIATLLYSLGLAMFFSTGYSSLYIVVPPNLMSIATSFVAILTYGSSMLGTYAFGAIAQSCHNNFGLSVLFLAGWGLIATISSIFVFIHDSSNEKVLYKQNYD